jgi:hypothetical protein
MSGMITVKSFMGFLEVMGNFSTESDEEKEKIITKKKT